MFPRPFGKYMLERELARGGMARVLLATLRGTDGFEKKLVVKQIRDELAGDPAFVERFVTEAKTAVMLNHPNIVPVFELGIELGTYYLTMELVRGVSVAELIALARRSETPMPFTAFEGAYLGAEICRALDYAHRTARVVHRDMTPRNVMVDTEGQVKLIDFGIAAKALAIGGGIFGSPGHMPPEQMRGEPPTPKADLFAVAVLLMEAWDGRPLFRRGSREDCEEAMRSVRRKPSDVDESLAPLDSVIEKALSMEPEDRPETAAEMGRVFRKYLQSADVVDVAKALGERVQTMLMVRASIMPPPMLQANEASALGGDLASKRPSETRTFAARAIEPNSEAPGAGGSSTRRLRSDPPSGPQPSASTRRLSERPFQSARDLQASENPVESLATLPLAAVYASTPAPKRVAPISDGAAARGMRYVPGTRTAVALICVCGGLAFAGMFWRARARDPQQAAAASRTSVSATPPGPAPVELRTPQSQQRSLRPEAAGSARTGLRLDAIYTSAAVTTPVGSGLPQAPKSQSDATQRAKAHLNLMCDMHTKAWVDGAARGTCPIRNLELAAGTHEVRFAFEPTGESLGDRVVLGENEFVTVRADFTAATPTVRVTRP
jgi:eukaryotic-like serine/threonine-protein kinase